MFALKRSLSRPLTTISVKGSGSQVEQLKAFEVFKDDAALSASFLTSVVQQCEDVLLHRSCTPLQSSILQTPALNVNSKRLIHKHTSDGYKRYEQKTQCHWLNWKRFGSYCAASCLAGLGTYYLQKQELAKILDLAVYADSNNKNNFIADVVQKAGPAVVFLEIKGRHPLTGRPVTLSNGSGFIVRSNGIILTNAHVVATKSTVSVKLQDGRVMEGQVTAVDPISDLATVKIPATNLPIIPLGSSSNIRPGEWVIAMGSPLSLSNTVTCGIVSSVQRASRELGLRNKDMDYIQTDAVINFGNSGGPLVNLDGQAIGINTMKVTTGISFAIPSDYAIKFLVKAEELMKHGRSENGFLKRRYMGITMLTLTENVMRDLKNNIKMPNFPDVDGGVFVYKVIPGSPAHIGGIVAGDIIIDISGTAIKSAADVYDAVEKSDFLKVTLIRGSEKKVIPIDTKQTI
ncbi:serine protease HTRA2, mitochondrial-like [Physella acuta]|uniref:serine protease HTRA2, mitochondrial-like n=1 Tax=Physella acuta TaxID=109671 RepID=UPI0027DAD284|nr:serine protease HTRA2, mitochondrial-like [Physella acuta]